jgi:hypothetical protein
MLGACFVEVQRNDDEPPHERLVVERLRPSQAGQCAERRALRRRRRPVAGAMQS